MSRRKPRDKQLQKNIARVRIKRLFLLAEDCALQGRMSLADRYVFLARKISMRYLVSIPPEFKRCFCKHCYRYLLPDVTGRVRIHRGRIIRYCFSCGKYMRMPVDRRMVSDGK